MSADLNMTETQHLARVRELDRQFREKRAREAGNALMRRATDRERLTTVDEEDAVRLRCAAALRNEMRLFPATGGQVVTGLYEPTMPRPKRRTWWQRLIGRSA